MGPVAYATQVVFVTKHLFAQVSSSEVCFGAFLLLDLWHVNYGQILTGKMKIALERLKECGLLHARLRL